MTSSTSAAADLEELRRFALDLEDRHLHGKRANIDDAFKWNQVVRIIGKLAALEAQQTDTLCELRTPSFDEWLKRLRACTTAFQHRSGAWTIFDQICHASSEVSEVYQAIRHDEGRPKMLEEICDSVLASITMAHVAGFTDAELGFAMEATLQKVERRAGTRSSIAEAVER